MKAVSVPNSANDQSIASLLVSQELKIIRLSLPMRIVTGNGGAAASFAAIGTGGWPLVHGV